MATPSQWAVREVALATFYDITTGKATLHLSNLKTSGIENSAETVYARGGRGNAKIVGFSGNREAKINLEDCAFTNKALAMMTGNPLLQSTDGTGLAIFKREVLVGQTGSPAFLTLTADPIDSSTDSTKLALFGVFELNADGSHKSEVSINDAKTSGDYTSASKKLAPATGITAGKSYAVYYQFKPASGDKITISSDKFAGSFKLVMDCLVKDTATKQDYYAQIVVPTCKMEDNWSITMSAEGDPSTFTMPIEVLKPANSTDMWTMTIYS